MVANAQKNLEVITRGWTKTEICLPKNNIIIHARKGFVPSFEKECGSNMFKLLSFAYKREWENERNTDYRQKQAVQGVITNELLHRKCFKKRPMDKKKLLPVIKLKRFESVLGKVDTNLGLPHTTCEM